MILRARQRTVNHVVNEERGKYMSRILVVDDDPDVVAACRVVLEREGYEVKSASNAVDGFRAVDSLEPDLLVLDVMMEEPDDGLRLARELRRSGHDLPILMLTSVNQAMGLRIDKDEEIVPVDEFLEKPVDPATLVARSWRPCSRRAEASDGTHHRTRQIARRRHGHRGTDQLQPELSSSPSCRK